MEVLLNVPDAWPLGVAAADYDWVIRGEDVTLGKEAVIVGEDAVIVGKVDVMVGGFVVPLTDGIFITGWASKSDWRLPDDPACEGLLLIGGSKVVGRLEPLAVSASLVDCYDFTDSVAGFDGAAMIPWTGLGGLTGSSSSLPYIVEPARATA